MNIIVVHCTVASSTARLRNATKRMSAQAYAPMVRYHPVPRTARSHIGRFPLSHSRLGRFPLRPRCAPSCPGSPGAPGAPGSPAAPGMPARRVLTGTQGVLRVLTPMVLQALTGTVRHTRHGTERQAKVTPSTRMGRGEVLAGDAPSTQTVALNGPRGVL